MKTLALTIALSGLVSLGNLFVASAENKTELYKNTEIDVLNRIETTSVYSGESGKNLEPKVRYEVTYDSNKNPVEKIIFEWNTLNSEWQVSRKYDYTYPANGKKPESISYAEWNEESNSWDDNAYHAFYLHDSDGKFLTEF